MGTSRTDLPPLPPRIAQLPLDHRGFPVPWFVAWIDGAADFRVVGPGKLVDAVYHNKCWICGERLGVHKAFLIGPMCAINRTIAEPPSHFECAEFSAKACPFLTKPRMRRNEKDIPAEAIGPAGIGIKRNPGAVCVWVTRNFRIQREANGLLFRLGDPESVHWYAEGRKATAAEVTHSIETGLPILRDIAQQDGPDAVIALESYIARARPLFPQEQSI